jgi:hypothetical protein
MGISKALLRGIWIWDIWALQGLFWGLEDGKIEGSGIISVQNVSVATNGET